MKQRWAMFVFGMWVAGSVFVSFIASQNFYTIDRLLDASESAAFRSAVEQSGRQDARDLLRYLSSELNRLYFQAWNVAQAVLAVAAFWLAGRRGSSKVRAGLALMSVIVLVMLAWLAPEITRVGRSLDFVPRDPAPVQLATLGMLHAAYAVLEVLKLVAGIFVAAVIAREGSR
jgi:hypothetical protein